MLTRIRWVGMETDDPARKGFSGCPQGQRWQNGVETSAIKAGNNGLADEGARPWTVSDTPEVDQDILKKSSSVDSEEVYHSLDLIIWFWKTILDQCPLQTHEVKCPSDKYSLKNGRRNQEDLDIKNLKKLWKS